MIIRFSGVCDCCDGADELIDLGCPNTCFKDLSSLRQDALLSYRKIQNGIRAKHDILEVIRRKEIMEQRSFDFLFQERKEITNLWLLLKLWLRREEQSDTRQQLRLLRERESRCALGDEQACDLFHPNWLDGDTLPEDGFRSIYANPRHRTDYQHSREEIQQVERLSGLERIRATLCLSKSLMPDESARVFTSVGEYEKFFSNTASSAILTKSSSQMKRETLFGPFLEFGERGYIEAACAASELIGIVLSPLTLSVRLFLKMLEVTWSFCWRQADFCQSNSECPYLLRLISMELMTIDSEDSIFFPLIQFFDLSSNGLFNDITEWLVLRFHVPLWVGSIAWRSPVMYWDYYVMGRGNELPPRRNTCLLKAGVQEAEIQLMDVIQKLKEKEEAREVALGGSGHSKSTKKLKLQKNSSSIDFGKDRIWESVSRLCLEGTFEQYKYKLCLFDTVKQDKLLIGKFLGWGGIGDLVDMSDAVSSKRSNSRRKRALVLRDLNADGINRKSTPGYYRSQVRFKCLFDLLIDFALGIQ